VIKKGHRRGWLQAKPLKGEAKMEAFPAWGDCEEELMETIIINELTSYWRQNRM
jgi:hypothetical protein